MRPRTVRLPDGRVWLRVADPDWTDPLDPTFAEQLFDDVAALECLVELPQRVGHAGRMTREG